MPIQSPVYIILNGAPGTGKSTLIARGLMQRFRDLNEHYAIEQHGEAAYRINVVQDSFAAPMKHFISTALGMKYADMKKDVMMGVLQGYTVREFLIDLSERYMKDRYNNDIFGRLLMHRILRIDPLPDLVVLDDGGFDVEIDVLGIHGKLVRVTRPNHDFVGDSRKHMDNPLYHFQNDADIGDPKGKEEIELKLDHLANWCLDQLPEHRRPPVLETA